MQILLFSYDIIGALLCLQKLGATPTLVETRCIRCTGWKSAEVRLKSAGIGAKKSSKGYSIIQSALHMCHISLHIAGGTMVDPMQELESANAASQSSNNLDPESTRSSLHPIAWRSSRLTWPFAWSKTERGVSEGLASSDINQIQYQSFKWID